VSVLAGVDVLVRDGCARLRGMNVGLVTNHTGLTRDGRTTIDVLHSADGVTLSALFAPEHGIRGALDEMVQDDVDQATGLPIYSLYNDAKRPRPSQLDNLDIIVYDIQDIGCRFYTYISTLVSVLEEAAKASLPVLVLDRPNPITGDTVEGPLAESDNISFTACHTIPIRHGMTVGELALLINDERHIGADVEVVCCEGWQRSGWWDATGLFWTNPSPNMRSLTQATLYPGIGLLEFTNVSVGRGTDTPFEVFGAPWMDAPHVACRLNSRNIPGVRFVPIQYKPSSSTYANTICSGINIIITDRSAFKSVLTGIEIAVMLHNIHAATFDATRYDRLLANNYVYRAFFEGASAKTLHDVCAADSAGFIARRLRYLQYT